jgi:hypothetical protein
VHFVEANGERNYTRERPEEGSVKKKKRKKKHLTVSEQRGIELLDLDT